MKDYIPLKDFKGTAREWLLQEYTRQERLGVKTGERFSVEFHPADYTQDKMFSIGSFEVEIKL